MRGFWKNYGSSLLLLAGVLVGGACGLIFKDDVLFVKPVGDIFLNLIFTLVVPLVFFSVASSICNVKSSGKVGKLLGTMVIVFLAMSAVAAILTYFGCLVISPLGDMDKTSILQAFPAVDTSIAKGNIGDSIAGALTVSDFPQLLSKNNILPLIVFSLLFGLAVAKTKSDVMTKFLQQGNDVIMKMMGLIMKIAPVGLGCYFAVTIAKLGSQILEGYLRVFILYIAITAVFFFIIQPLYVLIMAGPEGFKRFWKHILPPSLTAFATASSAATMPLSIEAAKKMGVNEDVADTVIPLGIAIHKDGSVTSGVIKVVFLLLLTGQSVATPEAALQCIGIAFLASVVMGAIPSGAVTGELLTCNLLGLDPAMMGIIIVIGTIVDMPATLLNSSGNVVGAIIVDSYKK